VWRSADTRCKGNFDDFLDSISGGKKRKEIANKTAIQPADVVL
jgi:hypothetical protein